MNFDKAFQIVEFKAQKSKWFTIIGRGIEMTDLIKGHTRIDAMHRESASL